MAEIISGVKQLPNDITGIIFDFAGRRSWSAIAGVCNSWRFVIMIKMQKWLRIENNLEIFTRPYIRMHARIPQTREIQMMQFTDDYDWRNIIVDWFVNDDPVRELRISVAFMPPGDTPDADICRDSYAYAIKGLGKVWSHLVHHPPAALILLDEFIGRLGKNTNTIFHVGSKYHRMLFGISKPFITKQLLKILKVDKFTSPRFHLDRIESDIYGIHRELLAVMIVLVGDSFRRSKAAVRKFLVDFVANTPITHANSRAAAAAFYP